LASFRANRRRGQKRQVQDTKRTYHYAETLKGKLLRLLLRPILLDPTYGEALAARLAASLAASLKLKNFSLEGDSKVVIAALNTPSITLDWHIESVIVNTLSMVSSSSLWEAKKIYKSANF
jgi:hypothetical protein